MKSFLLSFLLVSGMAYADVSNITVTNFNFTYTNPHGEGSATSFSRNFIANEGVYVTVDKVEKDFFLHVSGSEVGEFEFKNAPSFMTDAETMTVNGFNLLLTDALNLSLASGRFNSEKDSLKLDGLSLSCNRDLVQADLMNQLINGCTQRMTFKSSKFNQSSDKNNLTVNSVELQMNFGKFDLAAEIKAQISGKVKSSGTMSFDTATNVLTVKVSEIKLGILSVRGQVFKELKKNESEKLKVKEPYIYYTVK